MAHFSDELLRQLKATIKLVFWYKRDLKRIFISSKVPDSLINQFDWNDQNLYKIQIIDPVLDFLNNCEDSLVIINTLLTETTRYSDCKHLLQLVDGKDKKRDAELELKKLKELEQKYRISQKENIIEQEERQERYCQNQKNADYLKLIADLKNNFMAIYSQEPQKRGYSFEEFILKVLTSFDLEVKSSYRRDGEQIDGAFCMDNQHFLYECKWMNSKVNLSDLRDLDGAVSSALENTLGMFISISGFEEDAIKAYSKNGRPKIICFDSQDLMAVLDGQIDLRALLSRKIALAAQKTKIYVSAKDILNGTADTKI